ncbi:MAG: MFS transporter [Ktedonobacteraceae bacterium]
MLYPKTPRTVEPQGNAKKISLGLRANWQQFLLLVVINAFVGGMVGIERTVVPLIAGQDFGIASKTAILSFIATFGLVKAGANLFAGRMGDRYGRKRILVAGWLFGLPVPLLLIFAPSWGWIIFANMLLGINQGLCWSTTVIMKIDLAGPTNRGLAMGLNEAAGYLAVAFAALASGYLAATYALRPQPFFLGVAFAVLGLLLSLFCVRETCGYALYEATSTHASSSSEVGVSLPKPPSFVEIFWLTSWKDRSLFAVSQAGLVNNLNDGMSWGLFPLYFAAQGLSLGQIGVLTATYPAVWGVGQLGTGALSDRLGRKGMIASGMGVQALAIFLIVLVHGFFPALVSAILLGLGTALVYPTLLAAVGDVVHPTVRASAVGVYRLWRDSGYAVGALLAGGIADLVGTSWAIGVVGGLTLLSGIVVAIVMRETLLSQHVNAIQSERHQHQ